MTYRLLTKTVATLLLIAFLLPSGLHAKEFVEFCMMDSEATEMAAHHGDCHPGSDQKPEGESHSDCDWGFICACNIGQSELSEEDWVPTNKNYKVTFAQQGELAPFFTTGEYIPANQQIRIGEYDPPLWLLYDTFLM